MLAEQILELIFWLGVIAIIPTSYRLFYTASALLWRKLFPTKIVEIRYLDPENDVQRTVTIDLSKNLDIPLVQLLAQASQDQKARDVK